MHSTVPCAQPWPELPSSTRYHHAQPPTEASDKSPPSATAPAPSAPRKRAARAMPCPPHSQSRTRKFPEATPESKSPPPPSSGSTCRRTAHPEQNHRLRASTACHPADRPVPPPGSRPSASEPYCLRHTQSRQSPSRTRLL